MHDFMKTIISAIQEWVSGRIEDSTADWNQSDSSADSYIKNKPDVVLHSEFEKFTSEVADVHNTMNESIETTQATADSKMDKSNPVGTGSFSMNRKSGTTVGEYSHAEGQDTIASGDASHAEGRDTTASGHYSHAEGYFTTASASSMSKPTNFASAPSPSSYATATGSVANRCALSSSLLRRNSLY